MKLLKAHVTPLCNYDVLAFLGDVAVERGAARDLRRDIKDYLQDKPASAQTPQAVEAFLERISAHKVSTQEKLMMVNLRPSTPAVMCAILEDYNVRFVEDDIVEMVEVVASTLPDPKGEQGDGE